MPLSSLFPLPRRFKHLIKRDICAFFATRKLDQNAVFYEAFAGNGILDNPEALFHQLLNEKDFSHLKHIWVLSPQNYKRFTSHEYPQKKHVTYVRKGSIAYYRALATSKYLINNATFPLFFSKREGQIYINTWHGIPLKKMGYDMPDGATSSANIVRNFLHTDFLISSSPAMTQRLYQQAYKLDNIYRGHIIEEGYPRIDRQILNDAQRSKLFKTLKEHGFDIGSRHIILYAPTWRGKNFTSPDNNLSSLRATLASLTTQLDPKKYVILLKTHQRLYCSLEKDDSLLKNIVPNHIPTNQLLGISEILITDYSSIFFDFLQTERPIFFFTPDASEYEADRGLYHCLSELPGPTFQDITKLVSAIKALETNSLPTKHHSVYQHFKTQFVPHEDSNVSARIIDIIFRGNAEGYQVRQFEKKRKTLLLYVGGMKANGITSSALNLVANINQQDIDVSVLYAINKHSPLNHLHKKFHPSARHFQRRGDMNGYTLHHVLRRLLYKRSRMQNTQNSSIQSRLWQHEWNRCFGHAHFDHVIDFSGYGPFWSLLLLFSPKAKRAIWLHNDVVSDSHRRVNGKKYMLHSLTQVFRLYQHYDRLVSVSKALQHVNIKALTAYAATEAFTFARNTINIENIRSQSQTPLEQALLNEKNSLPSWLPALSDSNVHRFVTVGRLSPEKNHKRLIEAFTQVYEKNKQTQLVLVGDGPLSNELEQYAQAQGLSTVSAQNLNNTRSMSQSAAVVFTGLQSNPHAIMSSCNCFVLSSDYEGQPMVILEALVLQLPIVTVNFASARDALDNTQGRITAPAATDLAQGMLAFLEGNVPKPSFDPQEYNQKALEEFYQAIEL